MPFLLYFVWVSDMKKAVNTLISLGFLVWLLAILCTTLHLRDAGRYLIFFGLFLFIGVAIIMLFAPAAITPRLALYNEEFNSRRKGYSYVLNIGSLLLEVGLLFKLLHWSFSDALMLLGIVILLFSVLLYAPLLANKKKYVISSLAPAYDVPDDVLHRYAGSYYNDTIKMTMDVWVEAHTLTARLGTQSSFPLTPIKEHIFNCMQYGVVMEFHPDKGEFVLIQHGRYLPFTKQ
jgi:hypothetical protein